MERCEVALLDLLHFSICAHLAMSQEWSKHCPLHTWLVNFRQTLHNWVLSTALHIATCRLARTHPCSYHLPIWRSILAMLMYSLRLLRLVNEGVWHYMYVHAHMYVYIIYSTYIYIYIVQVLFRLFSGPCFLMLFVTTPLHCLLHGFRSTLFLGLFPILLV